MKKIYLLPFTLLLVSSAIADTDFRWAFVFDDPTPTYGPATDINSNAFLTDEATVFTFLDFDITAAPSYDVHATLPGTFQINISDIPTFIDSQNIIANTAVGGFWNVANNIVQANNDRVSQTAYAIVVDGGGKSSISVGDYLGAAPNSLFITDRGSPAATTQLLNGGAVITNIVVIPEPTTIAVLLMGILGLVGFRKHLRKN